MKEDSFTPKGFPDNILDYLNIQLLKNFQKYNSNGNNLFCSYMSVGQKYKNELLVIGREPLIGGKPFQLGNYYKKDRNIYLRLKLFTRLYMVSILYVP